MTNTTLTRQAEIDHAREVDTRIAAAWELYYTETDSAKPAQAEIKQATKSLRYARDEKMKTYYTNKIARLEVKIAEIKINAEPLRQAARELDQAEYEGWTRFYSVQHIHNTPQCSSFRPTTRLSWLPDVSGLTEKEAVAEHGAILCTICFPSAPVEYTDGRGTVASDVCSGAGKSAHNSLPARRGFYSGNWATCEDCGRQVGITNNSVKMPKHKVAA